MAFTAQEVIRAAVLKSRRNVLDGTADSALELLPYVRRAVGGIFSVTARVNRYFYGDVDENVAYDSDDAGWPRPSTAEMVWLIRNSDGDGVIPVPVEEPNADTSRPRVTRLGGVYKPVANNDLGPTSSDTLTFYFSRKPVQPDALTDNIDEAFPDEYQELLALETAIYLALKDGGPRLEEVPILVAERDRWLTLYLAHIEHETVGEVRNIQGPIMHFAATSVVPVGSLLAGGTNLQLSPQG